MIDKLTIATRESKLALWQANFVKAELEAAHPGLAVELLGMTTEGDQWLSSPLSEVGGKGLFIKALEEALLAGRAHLAVHSMKDVPATLPEAFAMPVIAYRADVRDALVSPTGTLLEALPDGALVGSSSLRRQAMLRAARPDLRVAPVRGNVGTRLDKLDNGDYDALLLASAGLDRLGLSERITERLDTARFLPAAGQGALGIECRADAAEVLELLAALDDSAVHRRVAAERHVSAGLGADCSAPLGCHATEDGDDLLLRAELLSRDGSERLTAEARAATPEEAGETVVLSLREQGAEALLAAVAES